jgi:DNA polymerase III alpha subunit
MSHSNIANQDKLQNQFSFHVVNNNEILLDSPKLSHIEQAMQEMEVTGLFLSIHPLSLYQDHIKQAQISLSTEINQNLPIGNSKVKLLGVIHKKDARMSGNRKFTILSLSDHQGFYEITIFNDEVMRSYGHLTNVGQMICVTCDGSNDGINVRLTAIKFEIIEDVINNNEESTFIINNEESLYKCLDLLNSFKKEDGTLVKIEYNFDNLFSICINLNTRFNLSIENINQLKQLIV